MKIAMIGHKRIPGREGGVETVVEILATQMAARGHSITAYNRARRGDARQKAYQGVRIVRVPTIPRKHLDAFVYAFFATLHALFGGYDVLHYHAAGPCLMLWLPRLLRRRTIATLHGLDWQRAKWSRTARCFLRLGERIAARHASELIVLTEDMRTYVQARYGRTPHVIPNGVEPPEPCPSAAPLARWNLVPEGYVLFLARLVPEKGLHTLLEAFAAVWTDMRLVVAGGESHTGAYGQKIRALAARDSRVVLTGFVEGGAKDALYHYARLYVLPSEVEGQPLSLLEAMSHGCSCLVSDIAPNLEASGSLAHTFRCGDVESLRNVLQDILDDKAPKPVPPDAIREAVLARHAWPDIVERTLNVYDARR